MTKEELKKLKTMMPKGYRETLAEEFDISVGYIDQIFRGEKTRIDVIDIAIKLATLHKEYLDDQKSKIEKL